MPRTNRPKRRTTTARGCTVRREDLSAETLALIDAHVASTETEADRDARARHAVNVDRGKKAQRSGLTLEKATERAHQLYKARDLACLSHLHPATAGPRDRLFRSAPGDCDYMGWWSTPHGARPLAFDLKSSDCASLKLPTLPSTRRSWIHQLKFLTSFGSVYGASAFFMVVDRDLGFGWIVGVEGMVRVLDGDAVPLRSISRSTKAVEHHVPHFALAEGPQAQWDNRPWIDWYPALHALEFPGVPVP